MKKIGKLFVNILIVAYAAIAIAVTVLLLSYNEYHCSVVGKHTFILVTDDELEPDFEEGSLVIVKSTKAKNVKPGDDIFLYRRISTTQFEIKYAEVLLKDAKGEHDASYVLEGGIAVDHKDVIGTTDEIVVVPHLGTILSILESRYGYLFLIVVVSFIAFLYEIYELIMEIKYGEKEKERDDYDDEYDEYDDDDDYEEDDEDYEDEEEEEIVPRRRAPAKSAKAKTSSARATRPAAKVATKKAVASKEPVKRATRKPVSKVAKEVELEEEPKVATKRVAKTSTAKKEPVAKKPATRTAKKVEKE